MKMIVSVSLDSEVIDWARKNLDNVSGFVENAIKMEMEQKSNVPVVMTLEEWEKVKEEQNRPIETAESKHQKLKMALMEIEELKEIPKTATNDARYMLALTSGLKAKYPILDQLSVVDVINFLNQRREKSD